MNVALITGSCGLVGSSSVLRFAPEFDLIVGVDNDSRARFFGPSASIIENRRRLQKTVHNYSHLEYNDIRHRGQLQRAFQKYGSSIKLVIHAAAQPSHDWAAGDVLTDFTVNATGTLNMLEMTRRFCPDAVFIFTSTNKVYGDNPNRLPLVEHETRWEINPAHLFAKGIPETMSIDHCKHSLFGVSKTAADLMVQEYGRYFGMKTAAFRCGCISGFGHAGAAQHGFLAYLMKCAVTGEPYTIYGYKGKQVRDNIDADDLALMFSHFYNDPIIGGRVYNAGGGRQSNVSMLEAIALCEKISGRKLNYSYVDQPRSGDHIWYISDMGRFYSDYMTFSLRYGVEDILQKIFAYLRGK